MRQLTQLELRRLTGTPKLDEQIIVLEGEGYPFTTRKIKPGGMIIDINVYDTQIRPLMTDLEWMVIQDENIGAGLRK